MKRKDDRCDGTEHRNRTKKTEERNKERQTLSQIMSCFNKWKRERIQNETGKERKMWWLTYKTYENNEFMSFFMKRGREGDKARKQWSEKEEEEEEEEEEEDVEEDGEE